VEVEVRRLVFEVLRNQTMGQLESVEQQQIVSQLGFVEQQHVARQVSAEPQQGLRLVADHP